MKLHPTTGTVHYLWSTRPQNFPTIRLEVDYHVSEKLSGTICPAFSFFDYGKLDFGAN